LDLVELARSLISFRTEVPPGNEEGCARFIRDFLADLHVDDTELRLDTFEEGRANLVARLGPREPGLLLSGHLDVVPAGEESQWSHPPFEGVVEGGRLYGRGAADMKMGIAAMLKAIEATAKSGVRLRRGISFVATAGEEAGFDGLKGLIERRLVPKGGARFGVLGEPTSLRPVRAHKGTATFRVTVLGKGGHASSPRMGVNAIEKCADFIDALSAWRLKVESTNEEQEELGSTIATPTMITGGTKSNVIPESCELIVDARWLPRHGTAFVERGLKSIISSLKRRDTEFDARVELLYDTLSLSVRRDHPAVRLAESLSGFKSELAPYGTEAALYTSRGIPSIVLGPGNLKQAHVVDEYVELRQANKALSIYTKMIQSVCVAVASSAAGAATTAGSSAGARGRPKG
jgi:succinyl-diaminopimelate desuccinylase